MPVQREYLSPNEIAELLGVSPFTIRRYIKLGELRAVKLLGGFRVHRDELQRFLKAHEVNPAEEDLLPEEAETDKSGAEKPEPPPPPFVAASPTPHPVAQTPPPGPEPAANHISPEPPPPAKTKTRGTRAKKSRRTAKT